MIIRVFGDSHVGALRRGWQQLLESGDDPSDMDVRFYASDGRYWLDCTIEETPSTFRISQQRPGGKTLDDYVVDKNDDLYVFSSPLHSAPLYRNKVWRTCCPWICVDRHPDLQALSSRVVESWANRQVGHRIELLDRLHSGGVSTIVVEPPKPLKRTPKMFGIKPDVLIAASDLYRTHVSGLLESRHIPIIRTPGETFEETGFTKSLYAPKDMKDYHHGNVLYGVAAMKKIVSAVRRMRTLPV